MPYVYLAIAIVTEVVATAALRASNGFSNLWPSVVVVVGYVICFFALAMCVKRMPIGVAYAIWSGVGIVLITIAGWYLYRQRVDLPGVIGMGLIIAGVLVIQIFSATKEVEPLPEATKPAEAAAVAAGESA